MDHALIEHLEAALRQAQLDGDVDALDRLVDDALLFVGPEGALVSKADDLALHRSGAVRFASHEPTDLQWRLIAPDVVVVALTARLAVVVHGQPFTGDYRYTRAWARRDGQWRVVAGHVSAMQSPKTA
jgi:ketosteroid isomerase-like protein